EEYFQRLACRFFVERGLRAFGTKFGWSQVDIHVEDVFQSLVIETKKFATPPSENVVVGWVSQLKSYMDQTPVKHRGALVLLNFSGTPIFSPHEFLHSRFFVLPINLCTSSPSRRWDHIDIRPAEDKTSVVEVVPTLRVPAQRGHHHAGDVPRSPRRKKK